MTPLDRRPSLDSVSIRSDDSVGSSREPASRDEFASSAEVSQSATPHPGRASPASDMSWLSSSSRSGSRHGSPVGLHRAADPDRTPQPSPSKPDMSGHRGQATGQAWEGADRKAGTGKGQGDRSGNIAPLPDHWVPAPPPPRPAAQEAAPPVQTQPPSTNPYYQNLLDHQRGVQQLASNNYSFRPRDAFANLRQDADHANTLDGVAAILGAGGMHGGASIASRQKQHHEQAVSRNYGHVYATDRRLQAFATPAYVEQRHLPPDHPDYRPEMHQPPPWTPPNAYGHPPSSQFSPYAHQQPGHMPPQHPQAGPAYQGRAPSYGQPYAPPQTMGYGNPSTPTVHSQSPPPSYSALPRPRSRLRKLFRK